MAETESEVVSTSGFKVRPLSKREPGITGQEPDANSAVDSAIIKSDSRQSPLSTIASKSKTRLRELTDELREVEMKLRLGGGAEKIERQHKQGKLTARERLER